MVFLANNPSHLGLKRKPVDQDGIVVRRHGYIAGFMWLEVKQPCSFSKRFFMG